MNQIPKGIEDTFNQIIEKQKIAPSELKDELESLQESFNFLFQKWSLEILYTLLLKDVIGFGGIKKLLTVNSQTLFDKLKILQKHNYITRNVAAGLPLRVEHALTLREKHCTNGITLAVLFQFSLTYGFN